jgi:hypothetical protein
MVIAGSIEEQILNDPNCSSYCDIAREYIDPTYLDGVYYGMEHPDMDELAKKIKEHTSDLKTYIKSNPALYAVYMLGKQDAIDRIVR